MARLQEISINFIYSYLYAPYKPKYIIQMPEQYPYATDIGLIMAMSIILNCDKEKFHSEMINWKVKRELTEV